MLGCTQKAEFEHQDKINLLIRKLLMWLDSFSKSFLLHYLYIETNEWNV